LWEKPREEIYPDEKRLIPLFERCTPDAQMIIHYARLEAANSGTSLQPQYLLLGLLDCYDSPPPTSTQIDGISVPSISLRTPCIVWVVEALLSISGPETARALKAEIERVSLPIRPTTSLHELPPLTLSREFEQVIVCADEEARAMGRSHIGLGHMLMGILVKCQTTAAILRGLQAAAVRQKLAMHLAGKKEV
jgi:hypothetical protein